MNRRSLAFASTVAMIAALIVGAVLARQTVLRPKTITAYFPTTTAIYPGDDVRVSGIKVGTISAIQPEGTRVKMTLRVDRGVPIPLDAKAVIVAQNLVAARYVQLAPAYRSSGPKMSDGAVIPIERTATPVEWDEVKTQLMRLATELGPKDTPAAGAAGVSDTSVSRFIDSTANAMAGNGDKLRQTLAQLSGVGRILADGSGNIVDVIKNLQTFVSALRDSNVQIVQFQNRLASLSAVLDDNRTELDAALTNLSDVTGDVQRFISGTRDKTAEQIQRLGEVTTNLVEHKEDLENVLHVVPNALGNAYNMYNPLSGTPVGSFVFSNFNDPVHSVCGMIGAVANVTAPETAKLCSQYLGPALRLLNFGNMPFPINPYLMPAAAPHDLLYTDQRLMPGGGGTDTPPEPPPAVSAYMGLPGDYPAGPVPGPHPPGIYAPDGMPAYPHAPLYPGAPAPSAPRTVPGLLLPPNAQPPAGETPP